MTSGAKPSTAGRHDGVHRLLGPLVVWALLVALLPPVTAEPPPDAFCVITIQPSEDFLNVRYIIDEETSMEDREALWPQVDTDGDGRVTPVEKDAFRRSQIRFHANASALGVQTIHLAVSGSYLNQQTPLYATTWREIGHAFHQRNYHTPPTITEVSDLETQGIRDFRFAFELTGELRAVTLYGGSDPSAPPAPTTTSTTTTGPQTVVIEYVVIRAPVGWVVNWVAGYTYDGQFSNHYQAQVVDVPAFDTKRPYSISFYKLPDEALVVTVTTAHTITTTQEALSSGTVAAAATGIGLALLVLLALIRRRM
jgi:hypothetical protein